MGRPNKGKKNAMKNIGTPVINVRTMLIRIERISVTIVIMRLFLINICPP